MIKVKSSAYLDWFLNKIYSKFRGKDKPRL